MLVWLQSKGGGTEKTPPIRANEQMIKTGLSCAVFALAGATLAAAQSVGPVTGLDMPRFVSIKTSKAYARRGPGKDQRIDWVFVRRNLPVRVTGEYGHWRRVEDIDGEGGWVHYSMLSPTDTAIVTAARLAVHFDPRVGKKPKMIAERGVVVHVLSCAGDWCEISVEGESGWAARDGLWGDLPE